MSARFWFLAVGSLLFPVLASAQSVTLQHKHFLFTLKAQLDWSTEAEAWTYEGFDVRLPPQAFGTGSSLPAGLVRTVHRTWDRAVIATRVRELVSTPFDRPARAVTIRTQSGAIVFDGVGMPGRSVDVEATVELVVAALEQGVPRIVLPVAEAPPVVTVTDPALRQQGITELVTIGESDFHNSPANRVHNIDVGIRRFNAHLIPQGSVFSFVETLGPVNASTGYRKELVIKGDRTEPDYGGGLCQISSTAYRGVWEYGFPITQRKNHSFAVGHYAPQGTDATIYPPDVDLKFRNDSPGALLIQTYTEDEKAYFLFYGTRDTRQAEVVGPFTWAHVPAPPQRTEETTEIPAGTTRKVGEATPGLRALWFRGLRLPTATGAIVRTEQVHSHYQARPRYIEVGVEAVSTPASLELPPFLEAPSWITPGA
jgi:vancomycin resistance protein YoaR